MSASVSIWEVKAKIDGYVWSSDDASFADLLNALLDPLGPSGSDPAPDYHAALAAVEMLGGEVTDYDLPSFVKGRVY